MFYEKTPIRKSLQLANKFNISSIPVMPTLIRYPMFLLLTLLLTLSLQAKTWNTTDELAGDAKNGVAKAQCILGSMYLRGWGGVAKDYAEGFKWLLKSADQGYAESQYLLGNCYFEGKGVAKDNAEALVWYRKAAEQGHASSQAGLGNCYYAAKNYTEALVWYRKAAEQGHELAQYTLARFYENGIGTPKDNLEALRWNRVIAAKGVESSQLYVANCYANGIGAPKDFAEAYAFYNLAGINGNFEEARQARDELEKKMTPSQVAEGQTRTKELQAEITKYKGE